MRNMNYKKMNEITELYRFLPNLYIYQASPWTTLHNILFSSVFLLAVLNKALAADTYSLAPDDDLAITFSKLC